MVFFWSSSTTLSLFLAQCHAVMLEIDVRLVLDYYKTHKLRIIVMGYGFEFNEREGEYPNVISE